MEAKTGETFYHSLPFRNRRIHIHKIRKAFLHAAKGAGNLHQTAQCDFFGQIPGHGHYQRENDSDLGVPAVQPGQLFLLLDNAPEIIQQQGKAFLKNAAFMAFPAVKGYALRIFTHTHHSKTEVCFVFLLHEVKADQFVAYLIGQPGADNGIQQGRPYQIARDMNIHSGQFELQRTR